MQVLSFNRLQVFSLFFIAHWFFGNLYEQIVLAPNQLVNTYEALNAWQNFFHVTNQIHYYVPFTQLAILVLFVLYRKARSVEEKRLLKKSLLFGVLALAITGIIITQLNFKLFFGDLENHRDNLHTLSILWLIGNALRMMLVACTFYFAFGAYKLRLATHNGELAN